ncbi:hypothetical protein LSP03_25120 [Lysinibacillus sphaericus]|nr:hypothetical protein LSP03_25120 [Lysinibacillus sphaericus]
MLRKQHPSFYFFSVKETELKDNSAYLQEQDSYLKVFRTPRTLAFYCTGRCSTGSGTYDN